MERWFQDFVRRKVAERSGADCPQVLGIAEHFFSRRHGYATTFCDLKDHTVIDVVPVRSEAALESYLQHLRRKNRVCIICMDLASVYRALVRKHFLNARIVADPASFTKSFRNCMRLAGRPHLWRFNDVCVINSRGRRLAMERLVSTV